VIPGFNSDEDNIRKTAEFVQSLRTVRRVDLLPYNRGGVEKAGRLAGTLDLMQAQAPGDDTMREIAAVLAGYRFEVKIGG
jgi:pyruvate formate lyase activating enzyme